MSKTFKTRPIDVQMFGKNPTLKSEPIHDHRDGRECDLPEPDYTSHVNHGGSNPPVRNCYWTFQYNGKNLTCGCPMCTRQVERKEDRRRDRHAAKTSLREAVKANGNDEVLDAI